MIINLDEHWFIDADEVSCALTERRVITAKEEGAKGKAPKAENIGKIREVQQGFFGTITQACQAYLNKGVASMDGMMTATQIIAAWADMTARIQEATKGIRRKEVIAPAVPVGHKGPKEYNTGVLVSDGHGGVVRFPRNLNPKEPLYGGLPQASL
jgi:hypothetical protein